MKRVRSTSRIERRLSKPEVLQVAKKLLGKPCWAAMCGYGSTLTFEFGRPFVVIHEPISNPRAVSKRVRANLKRRHAWVHGEWRIWLYLCHWEIHIEGQSLATSRSKIGRIERALSVLQGQALSNLSCNSGKGSFRFEFDFGGVINTRADSRRPNDVQWVLSMPGKRTLDIYANGTGLMASR